MRDMTEPLDTHDDQGDYDWDYDDADDRGPRPKILWGRVISLIVFMLIAFLIGRWSVPGGPSQEEFDDIRAENTRLQTQVAGLEQDVADLEAAVGNNAGQEPEETETEGEEGESPQAEDSIEPIEHEVQPGETLSGIVKQELKCTIAVSEEGDEINLVDTTADYNLDEDPAFVPEELAAGQTILIPPLPTGYSCA